MTRPINIEGIEDAIHGWIVGACGLPPTSVYHVEPALTGQGLPTVPAAQIQRLSTTRLGQPDVRRVPGRVSQRWTVTEGAGVVGVNFYEGHAEEPEQLSVTAGAEDTPEQVAAALLAVLVAGLPDGYTAALDPEDAASILVRASLASPLYAASTIDPARLTIQVIRERFVEVEHAWTRLTWRVTFRTARGAGFGSAGDLLDRAQAQRARTLHPAIMHLGWRFAGVLLAQSNMPADREEFLALFDFAIEGNSVAVFQSPALRLVGLAITPR